MAGTLLALWAMAAFSYQRREPDKTLLYRMIQENLATFLERTEQSGGTIPWFVRREFMEFSRCGVLAHGFVRFECRQCRTNRVVAFSCKRRGFCPSCGGRRMTERAARLVDSVLPAVPIRQWVLSVPVKVRYLIAYDSQLCSLMVKVFTREIFRWYRRRGKSHLQLKSMAALRCGSVTFIQRAGSSLNLNVHFHMLALDGVYAHQGWGQPLVFHALPSPSDAEVQDVVCRVRKRIVEALEIHGHGSGSSEVSDDLALREPLLAACVAGALSNRIGTGPNAGARTRLLRSPQLRREVRRVRSSRCAAVGNYSLHANTRVPAGDRKKLEKLCRYVARPPLSNELLVERLDGRIACKLKRPWHDGTTAVVFNPIELIERLVPLIPPPRTHQVRYHGVLASGSSLRSFVVPRGSPRKPASQSRNYCWAELMARAFEIDVLECPRCSGPMRLVATIMERDVIRAILGSVGLPADSPLLAPAQPSPQTNLEFDGDMGWDST